MNTKKDLARTEKIEAFQDMMQHIPVEAVRTLELQKLLIEYDAELREAAELQLRLRGEPITEADVEVEMSKINAKQAHEMAQEYAEGRGIFAGHGQTENGGKS